MNVRFRKRLLDQQTTLQSYLAGLGPYAIIRLDETSGLVADNKTGGDDGVINGVTLNAAVFRDGAGAPLWDSNTEYVNIYPCVDTEFSPLAGSAIIHYKVSAAGVWTDGVLRYILQLRVDGSNQILILKNSSNNQLAAQYVAGGTTDARSFATSSTDELIIGLTWEKSPSDQMVLYVQGVAQAPSTTLGTWAGSLSATECLIGNRSTNNAGHCAGYAGRLALFNRALTAAEMAGYYALVPN